MLLDVLQLFSLQFLCKLQNNRDHIDMKTRFDALKVVLYIFHIKFQNPSFKYPSASMFFN